MNYLFEPAVRLMNRLRYVYKFSIIGLLIVLQASALIYLLVSELNKNIDFAVRERDGVQYVSVLTDLFNEAQAYRTIHYDFLHGQGALQEDVIAQQSKVDAALAAVEEVDKQTAGQMDTSWKVEMLQQDWLTRKQNALQVDDRHAQVAFDLDNRWIDEVTDTMQHVGHESNLAMDSDFDTSYLVDSVLRKLPGLLQNLSKVQGLSVQLYEEDLSPDSKNQILQLAGVVSSGLTQDEYNAQQVFRHNESIKTKLKTLQTAVADSVPIFAWNIEQKTLGQQGLPVSRELLTTMGNQAVNSVEVLHKEELNSIDQLLVRRINQYLQYRNRVIGFTGGILLLVCYLFIGFDISVRKAVYQLANVMAGAGKGDLNVRGKSYSQDEMGALTHAINNTLDSLQKMYEEVQSSQAKLKIWNQELEGKVIERTASLRNLLDHAGQGFLSFGGDLIVRGEYSAECETIFHRVIAGESIPALIYPVERDQQVFLEAVFRKILCEEKEFLRETYFSLLPEEIVIESSYIGVAYKLIDHNKKPGQREIMLILTDRTLQKAMENQVQAERDVLAMIVHVVIHSSDFFAAVGQYTSFCQEGLPSMLKAKKTAVDILASVFRTIHTFKGTFGQLRMNHVMAKLHEMENLLDTLRSKDRMCLDNQQLMEKLSDFTPEVMTGWLDADMEVLKDKLGDDFFQQENMLVVDNQRLLELEKKVQQMLPYDEGNLLLPDLRRLRYQPIQKLLQSYPEYVVSLAERNEKTIQPFEIKGGEMLVDPLQYNGFIKSLGHVFRNSIVHGVESGEERMKKGKNEIGEITCAVRENPTGITVVISDDGAGIDIDYIRAIAVKKGICPAETAGSMDSEKIMQLLFADGFSGAENVDALAGRGVGLSAVRSEVEKLNGSIKVNTVLGKGTQFEFFLPLGQAEKQQPYSIGELGNPLVRATEILFEKNAGLQLNVCTQMEAVAGGKLKLHKVTSFLGIKGAINCRMVVSADQAVVKHLADTYFTEEDRTEAVLDKRMENVLSYYANGIFDRAVKELPEWVDAVTSEALVSIMAEEASAKYPQSETLTWLFDTDLGEITLSLIF
ncbi:MAG: ATP-binding protein [Selenomonadaceae bacterium]